MNSQKDYIEMALDSVENSPLFSSVKSSALQHGIHKKFFVLDDESSANKLGKKTGEYITLDLELPFFLNEKCSLELKKVLSECIFSLTKKHLSKKPNVLIVGLGNEGLIADALGPMTAQKINVTRHLDEKQSQKALISAISPNVLGETGIQSYDIVKGVVEKIKPELVIVIDTLCTSRLKRLYSSFQLSTAGIEPASGVGAKRKALDFKSLSTPILAIGVPLVANVKMVLREILLNHLKGQKSKNCDLSIESVLGAHLKNNIIVAPKEIDFVVEKCASIIADSINNTFC